jgi:hypothetical protein
MDDTLFSPPIPLIGGSRRRVFQICQYGHDHYLSGETIFFNYGKIMQATGFLAVFLMGIAVIAISYLLDHVWAAALPLRILYSVIRAPGVIAHECAHILGCILTGAEIRHVVLYSREGGSVTYSSPRLPYIGDVIISMAPLFAIPLLLTFLTMFFATCLGCVFPVFPVSIQSPEALSMVGLGIVNALVTNLVTQFNGWFLLYLYLTTSLVLSTAPSAQDMKNAAIGFFLIFLAGIPIIWSGIPLLVEILIHFMVLLQTGFSLGLVYGIIALIISFPLILWLGYTRSS